RTRDAVHPPRFRVRTSPEKLSGSRVIVKSRCPVLLWETTPQVCPALRSRLVTARPTLVLGLLLAAGCGGGTTGPLPPDPADCTAPQVITLSVGSHQVADPAASRGCLRLGGAGADEEYL